jgi:N-acetylmuramoyl-L-alanine amidase CwlA
MAKFRQDLVPASKYKIKCPYSMSPSSITIHNTANDASAKNEVLYMNRNNNEVSYHYAIDDIEIVQAIPENRNAWAAGDGGNGNGNRTSIHVEICYSRSGGSRYKKAEENTIKFVAQKLKERGWGIEKVRKHQDWSGKYCPHRILDEGRWNQFLKAIEKELNGGNDDMLDKAILIGGFPDFAVAEVLAARLKAPVYTRAGYPGGKVAKELYVVGGSVNGLQADKIINLSGKDRFAVAASVKKFLG